MSYTHVLEEIFSLAKTQGMNRSLLNIKNLCEIYNQPQNTFPSVHIAGTNGKGSVCTKIATTLHRGGHKTGLYTSPHISTFRERIRVDGQMISQEEMQALLTAVQKTVLEHEIPATFFEIATLVAFLYFQEKQVDIAIIETGLGGTWDATNVITPLLSVITSIGDEHTDVLGGSLEKITQAKGGIIKQGVPVVIGPDVPHHLIKQIADAKGSVLYQSQLQDEDWDIENQETARLALSHLPFLVPKEILEEGLKAIPPCRFEKLITSHTIILDVAHNPHGFKRLLQKLSLEYPGQRYRFVVGFAAGKDIAECAKLIEENAYAIHLVSGPHPRLTPVEEIQRCFTSERVFPEKTIAEGILSALRSEDIIVITGSFFIMCDARKALGMNDPQDPLLWYDPLKIIRTYSFHFNGTHSDDSKPRS